MPTLFNNSKLGRVVFLGDWHNINRSNLKDDLIIGRTILDRKFAITYKIVSVGSENGAVIATNGVIGGKIPISWWVCSKKDLLTNPERKKLIKTISKIQTKTYWEEALKKHLKTGNANFLAVPEKLGLNVAHLGITRDEKNEEDEKNEKIVSIVMESTDSGRIADVMLRKSKLMHWIDGPAKTFLSRCKQFADATPESRLYKKYNVNGQNNNEQNNPN